MKKMKLAPKTHKRLQDSQWALIQKAYQEEDISPREISEQFARLCKLLYMLCYLKASTDRAQGKNTTTHYLYNDYDVRYRWFKRRKWALSVRLILEKLPPSRELAKVAAAISGQKYDSAIKEYTVISAFYYRLYQYRLDDHDFWAQ